MADRNLSPAFAVQIIEGDVEVDDEAEVLAAWQYLLDTGVIQYLQGSYQRMAAYLVDAGELEA